MVEEDVWDPFADPADLAAREARKGGPTPQATKVTTWKPSVDQAKADARKMRILCLHGVCSCAAAMRKQISRLLTVRPNAVELICIDGMLATEEDNPMRVEQERYFKGMDFYDFARIAHDGGEDQLEANRIKEAMDKRFPVWDDYTQHMASHPADRLAVAEPRRYEDLEVALDYLQGQLRAHAPIDGVLGFSQGANFASLLAAQAEAGEGAPLSFVVHICPARPGWPRQRPELFEKPLTMRSLHISGERDFMNPPLCLKHLYEAPMCYMHEDGHRPIPGTSSQEANRIARIIVEFILNQP